MTYREAKRHASEYAASYALGRAMSRVVEDTSRAADAVQKGMQDGARE